MKKEVLDDFYNEFRIGKVLSKKDIRCFLEKYYGELKDSTLTWRIYDLKNEGYLKLNSNKSYEVLDKDQYVDFKVDVNAYIMQLIKEYNYKMKSVKNMYPEAQNINISIWNTGVLNKYTTHQVFKNYYIIEIDKLRMENLFFYLKSETDNIVVMKNTPRVEDILRDGSLFISNLPLKSPIQKKQSKKNNYVGYPKVEKILVDIFIYNKSILPYDTSEIENIYRNIYKRHMVKTKTVLNYARIRGEKTKSLVESMLLRIGEL